ncbi:MAG: hypothetical protein WAM79_05290 [Candidatus Sulfotelmatobacter sp.]
MRNSDSRFAEFGQNSAIVGSKSPKINPVRASITEKMSVHSVPAGPELHEPFGLLQQLRWLNDNGGHCDCEALANAEQVVKEAVPGYSDLAPSTNPSE